MPPSTERFLDEVVLHTTAFADAAHTAGQEARVPSCPEWTVRDLAEHLGGVHRWCAGTVSRPGEELVRRGATDAPMPESVDEVSTWLLEGAAIVAQTIRDAGEDTLVGGFGTMVPVSFWARRQCHETLMHRADAELAAGVPTLSTSTWRWSCGARSAGPGSTATARPCTCTPPTRGSTVPASGS